MSRPDRFEIEAAGQLGHVFVSKVQAGAVPARPAVVLIHGIGVSHRYLRRLHGLLAETGDTYSIDLPGFGATPRPGHALSVADHATYILGALEQLGVLEFVLVGHSMGSQFAIEAALQQPGRISHVVLMGPVVDSKRRSVLQQALALGRDSLFFESPVLERPRLHGLSPLRAHVVPENPARHDGLPHRGADLRSVRRRSSCCGAPTTRSRPRTGAAGWPGRLPRRACSKSRAPATSCSTTAPLKWPERSWTSPGPAQRPR